MERVATVLITAQVVSEKLRSRTAFEVARDAFAMIGVVAVFLVLILAYALR